MNAYVRLGLSTNYERISMHNGGGDGGEVVAVKGLRRRRAPAVGGGVVALWGGNMGGQAAYQAHSAMGQGAR